MNYTNTSSKEIINYTSIDKTIISKFKNNRPLLKSNSNYKLIKSFFINVKKDELRTFFNTAKDNISHAYDKYFENSYDTLKTFFYTHKSELFYISFTKSFNVNNILEDNFKESSLFIIKYQINVVFHIDNSNKMLASYIFDMFAEGILRGYIKIYLNNQVDENIIYIKNRSYKLLSLFNKKVMFTNNIVDNDNKKILDKYFNNLEKDEVLFYRKLITSSVHLFGKTIRDKLDSMNHPLYITSQPHYAALSETTIQTLIEDQSSNAYKKLINIVNTKNNKDIITIVSSKSDFLQTKPKYIAEGLSVFLNEKIEFSPLAFKNYLENMLLSYLNEYINIIVIDDEINYNITFLDNYANVYKFYEDGLNFALFIDDKTINSNLKKIWTKKINYKQLSKQEVIKVIKKAIKNQDKIDFTNSVIS